MLERYLASLDHGQLVALLHEAIDRDPGLRQRLELRAVTDEDRLPTADELTSHLALTLRIDGFLDRDQTRDLADTLDELTDRLHALHQAGHAHLVIEAIRQVLTALGAATDVIDDIAGRVAAAATVLADFHATLCTQVRPEPIALARWLLEFQHVDPSWPAPELADYVESLGSEGLDWYGAHLSASWEQHRTGLHGDWLTHLMEQYATIRQDTDLLVRVLRGHRTVGVPYRRIVEVLTVAGRPDEALTWAERGIAAAEARVDHDLVDFVARRYTEDGRHADVCALREATFERCRSLPTYQRYRDAATVVGTWQDVRSPALDLLRPTTERTSGLAFHNHVLVEVLLWEDAIEEAWSAAQRYGANPGQWEQLAAARAARHPAEAIAVYQRLIEQRLAARQKHAHVEAAALILRLRDLYAMECAQDEATAERRLTAYLERLLATHQPKRAFLTELERRGI